MKSIERMLASIERAAALFLSAARRFFFAATRPTTVAVLMLLMGCAAAVGGVHLMLGTAWALIAASIPLSVGGVVLLRGVINASV